MDSTPKNSIISANKIRKDKSVEVIQKSSVKKVEVPRRIMPSTKGNQIKEK